MATSQNGWRAGSRTDLGIRTFHVPGSSVRLPLLPGPAAEVLLYVAARFDREVEDIDTRSVRGHDVPDDWAYAERKIRGSETTLSNHASGTAIDLNAVTHPLGVRGTFTAAQVRAIRRILDDCRGVVRWGGDYRSRADEMHFEINASYSVTAALAASLGDSTVGSRIPPIPAPTPVPEDDSMSAADVEALKKYLDEKVTELREQIGNVGQTATNNRSTVPLNTWAVPVNRPDEGGDVRALQELADAKTWAKAAARDAAAALAVAKAQTVAAPGVGLTAGDVDRIASAAADAVAGRLEGARINLEEN